MPNWIPLENDSRLLNKYISNLGVDLQSAEFCDVFGFDDDLLGMIPKPVLAFVLLFPITNENEVIKQEEDESESIVPSNVWFIKQTIGNACGTIAVLHSVANNLQQIKLQSQDCFIARFLKQAEHLDPSARATLLEDDKEIGEKHEESASESTLDASVDTDVHFVAFIENEGRIFELDGRRSKPQYRGDTDHFLTDVAAICRARMALNPNDWIKFSAMAFVGKSTEETTLES